MLRHISLPGILLVGLLTPLQGQSLGTRLNRLLDAPPFDRHHWGVVVLDTTGKVLYQRNPDRLFLPASNTKLVVSAVATALLPPDSGVATSAYAAGPVQGDRIRGDLVLYGRGDPTMSRRCFDADTTRVGACENDSMRRFRELATALRARGIRVVEGDLIGDGSFFEPTLIHDTWETGDLMWWYAAPVSGLAFNDNSIDVTWNGAPDPGAPAELLIGPPLGVVTIENRTVTGNGNAGLEAGRLGPCAFWLGGSVTRRQTPRTSYLAVSDPNRFAATAFRSALAEVGIAVLGTTGSTTDSMRYLAARAGAPLAQTFSRPFREWLVPILGPSQNLYAEMLLKQVAHRVTGIGGWKSGLEVERRFLIDSVGVDSTQFSFRDGSGLSHVNVASPLTFARLLLWIRRRPGFPAFEQALPLAGRTGTLQTRLAGTTLEGRVRAKTGTVSRTNALSGYLTLPNGQVRIFSILTNNHDLPGSTMVARIDSLVLEIGRK